MHRRQQSIERYLVTKPKMKPYHTTFPQFPKLPTELRAMVWKLTLHSRTIEIEFQEARGFYTRVGTPVALRVCRDSRNAVILSYPVCFGNILFEPRTAFNFSLDTLFIGNSIQEQTLHLLAGLNAKELSQLKSLAVDTELNFNFEYGGDTEIDYIKAVKKAAQSMTSLKVFQMAYDLVGWLEAEIDEGRGPVQLFKKWPPYIERSHFCSENCDCGCDGDLGYCLCGLHDLPIQVGRVWDDAKAPKIEAIWSWRPVKQVTKGGQ